MGKYISKSAVVAEIEKRQSILDIDNPLGRGGMVELALLKNKLDTLEVKEVDLQSEIDRVWDNTSGAFLEDGWKEFEDIAKHFFELGVSVNNPITAADRGMAEEIIINLKRVEQDYRINLTREIEWLRNQVKKGEDI